MRDMEHSKNNHTAVGELTANESCARYLRLFPDYDPTPAPQLVSDADVAVLNAYTERRKKMTREEWVAEIKAISAKHASLEKTSVAY